MPINWEDYEDAPGYGVAPRVNLRGALPAITRGVGAILPGGPIGAAGNFLLEGLAQGEENLLGTRRGMNAAQLATQAGLGAIPFGKAASLIGTLGKGAALGAGGTLATQQAETGLHIPTQEELQGVALGGALGAGAGGLGRYIQGRVRPGTITPEVRPAPGIGTKQADLPLESAVDFTRLPEGGEPTLPGMQFTPPKAPSGETPQIQATWATKGRSKELTKGAKKAPKVEVKTEKTPTIKTAGYDPATGKIDLGGPVVETPTTKAAKGKIERHPVTGKPIVETSGTISEKLKASAKLAEEQANATRLAGGIADFNLRAARFLANNNPPLVNGIARQLRSIKPDMKAKFNPAEIAEFDELSRISASATKPEGKAAAQVPEVPIKGKKIKLPKGVTGESHEMAPRKPRGERKFFHQEKPPEQQIPIPPNKVIIPGEGSGTTAPVIETPWEKFKKMTRWQQAKQLMNEQRQAQTTGDLSFGLRQGAGAIHTKEWRDSLKPMWEAAKSQQGYDDLMGKIASTPKYEMKRNAGLELIDLPKSMEKLSTADEATRGTLLDHYVPPVAMSNRGYAAMANKLRSDLFDRITGDLEKLGVDFGNGKNDNARRVAELINDMTGRGKLPFNLDRAAEGINHLFFSPKLIASRLNMLRRLFADPRMLKGADPIVAKELRKEAWKSMAAIGSLAATGATISALMFNQPSTADITSADFGKLRTGNTRIDFTGGFQQYVRTAAQLAKGMAANTGLVKSDENTNVLPNAIRFGRAKLAPLASTLVDMMAGKDVVGEELGLGSEAKQLMVPLVLQDLEELIREDPSMALPGTALAAVGAGVQSYDETKRKTPEKETRTGRVQTPRMFKVPKVKLYQPGY